MEATREAVTGSDDFCSHCGQPTQAGCRRLLSIARYDQVSLRAAYPAIFTGPSQYVCRKCYRLLETLARTKALLDARQREDGHHPVPVQTPLLAKEHEESHIQQRPPAKRPRVDVSDNSELPTASPVSNVYKQQSDRHMLDHMINYFVLAPPLELCMTDEFV